MLLLAAVIVGTACSPPTPSPTLTLNLPTPTPIVTPTPNPTAIPTSTLAPNELDPLQFIPLLRQVSVPFDEFYGNEIEPLHVEIHWFYNPNLDVAAITTPLANGERYKIELLHIPSQDQGNISLQNDAFIIAHELATILIVPKLAKGWRLQCSIRDIYLDMFDMISTPLRNRVLAQYHFDVLHDFKVYLNDLFHRDCPQPPFPMIVHDYSFKYVLYVLYWQYALGNSDLPPEAEFWFQSCAPDARREGIKVLGMIDEIGGLGNITVDSAKKLFKQIIGNDSLDCQIIEIE